MGPNFDGIDVVEIVKPDCFPLETAKFHTGEAFIP